MTFNGPSAQPTLLLPGSVHCAALGLEPAGVHPAACRPERDWLDGHSGEMWPWGLAQEGFHHGLLLCSCLVCWGLRAYTGTCSSELPQGSIMLSPALQLPHRAHAWCQPPSAQPCPPAACFSLSAVPCSSLQGNHQELSWQLEQKLPRDESQVAASSRCSLQQLAGGSHSKGAVQHCRAGRSCLLLPAGEQI